MPEGIAYVGSNSTFTGPSNSLITVGDHAYAFGGKVDVVVALVDGDEVFVSVGVQGNDEVKLIGAGDVRRHTHRHSSFLGHDGGNATVIVGIHFFVLNWGERGKSQLHKVIIGRGLV